MRSIGLAGLAALSLAGCAHHREAPAPAGIPYACADGKAARITYEGGGYFPQARARLVYDGRDIELTAVPPTYGLRYVTEGDGASAPIMIWSARGEEAWLTQLDPGREDEREIAHCLRVREGAAG